MKNQYNTEVFRPYDLMVNTVSENQKELTLDEYYTISAHGIVHVFTAKGKKGKEGCLLVESQPTITPSLSLARSPQV